MTASLGQLLQGIVQNRACVFSKEFKRFADSKSSILYTEHFKYASIFPDPGNLNYGEKASKDLECQFCSTSVQKLYCNVFQALLVWCHPFFFPCLASLVFVLTLNFSSPQNFFDLPFLLISCSLAQSLFWVSLPSLSVAVSAS